jgi:hypothetical protein
MTQAYVPFGNCVRYCADYVTQPTSISRVASEDPSNDLLLRETLLHARFSFKKRSLRTPKWVMEMIGVAFVCPNVWLSADEYLVQQIPGAAEYFKCERILKICTGGPLDAMPVHSFVEALIPDRNPATRSAQ